MYISRINDCLVNRSITETNCLNLDAMIMFIDRTQNRMGSCGGWATEQSDCEGISRLQDIRLTEV